MDHRERGVGRATGGWLPGAQEPRPSSGHICASLGEMTAVVQHPLGRTVLQRKGTVGAFATAVCTQVPGCFSGWRWWWGVAEYTVWCYLVRKLYVDIYCSEQVPPVLQAFGWGIKNSQQPAECFLWCLLYTRLCAWHNLRDNEGSTKFTATKELFMPEYKKQTFQMFVGLSPAGICGKMCTSSTKI